MSRRTDRKVKARSAVLSEMAHALGICGHSLDPNHLMYVGGDDTNENIYWLTEDESAFLKTVYEVYSNG